MLRPISAWVGQIARGAGWGALGRGVLAWTSRLVGRKGNADPSAARILLFFWCVCVWVCVHHYLPSRW